MQRAAMQMCHRLHQGEAQAGARRAARRLAAEEALGGAGAILRRNARPLVGDGDRRPRLVRQRADSRTSPPGGENLTALSIRLVTACRSMVADRQ